MAFRTGGKKFHAFTSLCGILSVERLKKSRMPCKVFLEPMEVSLFK
ncbi:hypothetical protein HGH47_12255 [Treponema sp. OMZ 805]